MPHEPTDPRASPSAARYLVKLMFEWRGGALWPGNAATRARFGVDSMDEVLGLSDALRRRLQEMGTWHDSSLDWDDPAGPSPWPAEEFTRFAAAAAAVHREVAAELGPDFEVFYREL